MQIIEAFFILYCPEKMTTCFVSVLKRVTYGEVPSPIIFKIRMKNRPTFFSASSRIIGFPPGIETKQKEIHIQTQSQSVPHRNLPVK